MSDTPRTDALTAGCIFGPFVKAIAEEGRKLERELAAMTLRAERAEKMVAVARDALRDFEGNFDCENHAYQYNGTCRSCESGNALRKMDAIAKGEK